MFFAHLALENENNNFLGCHNFVELWIIVKPPNYRIQFGCTFCVNGSNGKIMKGKDIIIGTNQQTNSEPIGHVMLIEWGRLPEPKFIVIMQWQLNMFGNFANSLLQTLRYAHNIGPYDIYEIWNLFLILCHFNFAHTAHWTVHAYILFLISSAPAREKSHWPLRPKTHHKQRSLPILKSNPLAISVQKLKKKEWEFFTEILHVRNTE